MNDYKFGNQLYKLRKEANLSQMELANLLGLTNKAVSKWENGKAKPSTEILKKLSLILNVSIEKLLNMKEENQMKKIIKIVVTGGPCAGKSTAQSKIQSYFSNLGYTVLFVPETATEFILAGITPKSYNTVIDFQTLMVKHQLEKESIYEEAAKRMPVDKILLVCDRGVMDNLAYMSDLEFQTILNEIGRNKIEIRDNYDAVFHLVTAADGAEKFYTTANNEARKETIKEAIALDRKTMQSWTGHPHLRVIDNSTDFDNKMKKLLDEVASFLGEPEPLEIERKYLIEYPDIAWLETLPNCQKVDIIQTYLNSNEDEEVRVRQRGINGNYVYYKTSKKKISDVKRIEVEERLTEKEYVSLLMEADPTKRPIRKTRYCLMYQNQYFELDIYPFWKEKSILEIELSDENAKVKFPKEFKIIKEVTEDEAYKNASLAKI